MKQVLVICCLFVAGGSVYAQSVKCRLVSSYVDREAKMSSSRHRVGEFLFKIEEGSATKRIRHEETGVNVSVGVEYDKSFFEGEPKTIRLAIAFAGKPEDVFDEVGRAEAETIYDRHWRWLSVSKDIEVGSRVYTYSMGCGRIYKR